MSLNREAVIKIAREKLWPSLLERDREGKFDEAAFRDLASAGFFSHDPRTGTDEFKQIIAAFYDLGRFSMDIPFAVSAVAQLIVINIVREFGGEHQKRMQLPKLESGDVIAGIANSEGDSGTDLLSMKSKVTADSGLYMLDARKPCFTNGPAGLVLLSAWFTPQEADRRLEVFLLPGDKLTQTSRVSEIVGFRTGLTGSCLSQNLVLDYQAWRVGGEWDGFHILKYCFDIERLLIGCALAGALAGMLDHALDGINGRRSYGKGMGEHQYVQNKIVRIFTARQTVLGLIRQIEAEGATMTRRALRRHDSELALLKSWAVEESFAAATAFLELAGHRGVKNDHVAQKFLRDVSILKFLGGTSELQKLVIFENLASGGNKNEESGSSQAA